MTPNQAKQFLTTKLIFGNFEQIQAHKVWQIALAFDEIYDKDPDLFVDDCYECQGSGESDEYDEDEEQYLTCEECDGAGVIDSSPSHYWDWEYKQLIALFKNNLQFVYPNLLDEIY